MQVNRSSCDTYPASSTMDSSRNHPLEAASAAMTQTLMPRDETATTGPDPDPDRVQEENSADLLDKSDYGSEAFANNPGKSLCVHALSSDSDEEMGEKEKENLDASAAEAGEPSAASTPLREEMNRFRIVDVEPKSTALSGICKIGDRGPAADADVSMDTPSDANAASGEAFSATDRSGSGIPEKNHNGDANSASEANSAAKGDANSATNATIPLRLQKVPAMFKPPPPPQPKPAAEAPATPSATYKAIMGGRSAKNSNSVLAGTGSAKSKNNCGSFFNQGYNRVLRSVYKENVATLTVSSLSFNPVSWECSACPKKHSILGGGGGGEFSANGGGGGL
jgi:hypothetical protein